MFIILLTYTQPIEIIDEYLGAHRAYLDEGYKNNYLIASGPQNPRVGGVLLSQLKDSRILENYLKQDPFSLHGIATYQIIEFTPVKYQEDFARFL